MSEYEAPDLSHMTTDELCQLMIVCAMSNEQSDRDFAKACKDEIAKRKHVPKKQS